ncbi:NAD(P)/FAD-dependent oxidoreductase [Oceanicoccus sagamiensis]|uniref:FAD-dependent oxidoreductase n=1 Tax=Oceanicoccus sagamiensis TaxID=716816 RepID=A0A1X9N9P8_9GAMM|nr:FAD-dependent oxidoreductase [Oceanicoccus sagamiensis]ARN72675.1 FAD-dependent oxidoreductase [Oceanicoccus sagamiensis]
MKATDQRQEHTGSYYAASVNEKIEYPSLEGAVTVDVCVVGGGFTGVSTALSLAERGYSVAIVEANRIGWGASGRNGGQLINGITGLDKVQKQHGDGVADMIEAIRWRGNDLIRERVAKYNIDCDLKNGFVEVANKPSQVRWLEAYAEERERLNTGHKWELWDRDQTCENLGTEAFHGGFACYRDGHVHPLNLCIGEAKAAAGLGVKIFEQSPVTDIKHGAKPIVKTANGSVEADSVVLAGNAYSQFEPKHLSNLVFPAGSYIVATEPLSEEVVNTINPLDVAVCDLNEVVDYYRLSADNRLLYGGACNYSGRDPASIKSYIFPRMKKVYPQLKDITIEYEWGGKIGIVLRRIPTVGRIENNIYYCQGYSGHGVCASHVMGEVMADAVTGTMERFDLFAEMKHFRMPGSQWMGNQIIALGMLYYKLMDRL